MTSPSTVLEIPLRVLQLLWIKPYRKYTIGVWKIAYPHSAKYVVDEKAVHWAAKFSTHRPGSYWMGKTYSTYGRYYRWPSFVVTPSQCCEKEFLLKKLNVLKRTSCLGKNALLDLHFKVTLPFAFYGLLEWGASINAEQLNSLETVHRRAASGDIQATQWHVLSWCLPTHKLEYYKLHEQTPQIISKEAHPAFSHLVNRPCANYNLRKSNSYFLKNSVGYRGDILWNLFHRKQFKTFYRNVKKDTYVKGTNFTAHSISSVTP